VGERPGSIALVEANEYQRIFMKSVTCACLIVAAVTALCAERMSAQASSTVYFLAAGPHLTQPQEGPQSDKYESFVVPVADQKAIANIRSLIQQAKYPVVNVRIKAGGDGLNRDFYAPGAPAWNWSVTELLSVQGDPDDVFIPEHGPLPEDRYGSVSMIAADPQAWISEHTDQLAEQWFPLTTEVNPSKTPTAPDPELPVMANLSSRAITANGQDILIGGISIKGSRPKQVAVRCTGSSLLGRQGILTQVGTPHVRVYSENGTQLCTLVSQRQDELAARFSALKPSEFVPNSDTLAIITLYPGQYTFHAFDYYNQTGVVLFELYDLSLAPQPFP
jgi:hypothetical protein